MPQTQMIMKKHISIIIIAIFVLAVLLGIIYMIQSDLQNSNKEGFANKEGSELGQKSDRSVIEKINPTEKGIALDEEGTTEIITTEEYSIVYYASDISFFITILKKPFYENRIMAEEKFVEIMDITKEEACGLNVVLTFYGSDSYDNYGLGFCPNGKEFDEIKNL